MSLIKYIETGTEFFDTGEQTVNLLLPYRVTESYLVKQASEISEYIRELKSDVNRLYLHINALGSSDHWGMNANGDVFPESQLLDSHKTFEQYGNFYKHHMNKPQLGHKVYGKVLFAYYNPTMHRVELIAYVNKDAAPDIVQDIDDGKDVAVSMATKVPYDTCTVRGCDNVAKVRKEYCEHGKTMLTKVLEDGQQVGRINPPGKFFDISKVFRPADRTGYVLRKVANRGYVVPSVELAEVYGITDPDFPVAQNMEKVASPRSVEEYEKFAQVKKLAEIEKQVLGQVDAAAHDTDSLVVKALKLIKVSEPTMSDNDISDLRQYDMRHVLGRMISHGMDVKYPELVKLMHGVSDRSDGIIQRTEPFMRNGFSALASMPEVFYGSLPVMEQSRPCTCHNPVAIDSILHKYASARAASVFNRVAMEKQAAAADLIPSNVEDMRAVLSRGIDKEAAELGVLFYMLKLENPLYKQAASNPLKAPALSALSEGVRYVVGPEFFNLRTPLQYLTSTDNKNIPQNTLRRVGQ